MRSFIAILAIVCLCEARPSLRSIRPSFYGTSKRKIVGGGNAVEGVWTWQLSQTNNGEHSCGATLLAADKGLSASHCVDGQPEANLAVIAGLYQRSNVAGTQQSGLTYTMHESYDDGSSTYANDIAILHITDAIEAGVNVEYGLLPTDNIDQFIGATCVLTGWGFTDSTSNLADTLQEVYIEAISTTNCRSSMDGVAVVTDGHICFYDTGNAEGACTGDSGGPANCPNSSGGYLVAGIASFIISNDTSCLQTYPSAYTRTSYYLDWIATH